jgi:hypothetical protein
VIEGWWAHESDGVKHANEIGCAGNGVDWYQLKVAFLKQVHQRQRCLQFAFVVGHLGPGQGDPVDVKFRDDGGALGVVKAGNAVVNLSRARANRSGGMLGAADELSKSVRMRFEVRTEAKEQEGRASPTGD